MRRLRISVLAATLFTVVVGLGHSLVVEASTELVYWHFLSTSGDNPRERALRDNIARFEGMNPGIKVKVETVPFSQTNPRLIQAAAAGRTPDIVHLFNMFLGLHEAAGTIEPLDAYAKNRPAEGFLISRSATTFGGKLVAIPHDVRVAVLQYRDDLLKQAGIGVPSTWAEMCDTAKRLSKGNISGYEVGMSKADLANNLVETFVPLVWAAGGDLFDAQGKAAFNSAAGAKALGAITQCLGITQASLSHTYNTIHEGLRAGTLAMGTLSSHRINTIREQGKLGDRLRTIALPGFREKQAAPGYMTFFTLVIGRHSQNKEAAWRFIDFMTSAESEVRRAPAGEMPVRAAVYQNDWFKKPEAAELISWKNYMAEAGRTFPHPQHWETFMLYLGDATQAAYLKQMSPEAAVTDLANKYNALLRGR